MPGVRRCADDALPPGYTDGHAFVAPVIEMPVYLGYLMDRFLESGERVEHRAVTSLEEAGEERVVVNCAGLGARELVGDPSIEPMRGQIVRVRNPRPRTFRARRREPGRRNLRDPTLGRLHPGRHSRRRRGTPSPTHRSQRPSCAAAWLSNRGSRRPGARAQGGSEAGTTRDPARNRGRIQEPAARHSYGHGGSGVTLSWGCAEETLRLVLQALDS